jgi:branched-chain amino acid transport system substrate-binding protein
MNRFSLLNLLMILLISFIGLFPTTGWGTQEYRIGAVFPLMSPIGRHQADSLTMLVEQINNQGGIKGNRVRVSIEDSRAGPENAISAVRKLTDGDKVSAIIGPSMTRTTLAVIPIVEQRRVPLISCAFGVEISELVNRWVFQSAPRSTLTVDKALTDLKSKGISRIASFGPTLRQDLRSYILRKSKQLGLQIVEERTYDLKETEDDIIAQYSQVNGLAQAILNYQPEIKLINNRWADTIKSKQALFYILIPDMTTFNISPSFPRQENIRALMPKYLFARFVTGLQKEKLEIFAGNYMKRYRARITIYDIPVYDSLMIIMDALKKVGPDGLQMRNHIENMTNFTGAAGPFNFSPKDHNGLSPDVFEVHQINLNNGCPDELHKCVKDCSKCADSERDC